MSLTMVSSNRKTGFIPVSTSSAVTCPDSCTLKGKGCYAELGQSSIHWRALTNGIRKNAMTFSDFCSEISKLPVGQVWRHNESGDLQTTDNVNIHEESLESLVAANKGKNGYTYTHYSPTSGKNGNLIESANKNGFTVNISADNETIADQYVKLGIAPVVVVCKSDQTTNFITKEGNRVVICPSVTKNVQCKDCRLCQRANRSVIVGFPAHGSRKFKIDSVLEVSK